MLVSAFIVLHLGVVFVTLIVVCCIVVSDWNHFVSVARFLMCELLSFGRHHFSATQFRGLVMCVRFVIASLACTYPSELARLCSS